MTISKKAYAKINLYLKILDKRQDGYHNIFTIMQKISLADEMKIDINPGKKNINVECQNINIKSEENTAYRAAALFLERSKISEEVDISIEKKIPARAGLGGGSSDAACVLLALNEYHDFVLPENELTDIAAKVGADVPFFLNGASCALCEGIGEIVTPLKMDLTQYVCLIAKPTHDISTKQAYEDWDRQNRAGEATTPEFPFDILNNTHNDFTKLAFSQNEDIQKIYEEIKKSNALAAGLCGSGSALFGVFDNLAKAQNLETELEQKPDVEFCGIFDFV